MSQRPAHALSELSVTEFLTLARVGFYPHGIVIGSALHEAGTRYSWSVSTAEVKSLTKAMRDARTHAMTSMRAEAQALGAEGVVDVRLELEHHVWRGARQVVKFVAMGTAVGFDRERAPEALRDSPSLRLAGGDPFTSDLTAPDFVALLRAGFRPVTLAMASCVFGLDPREMRAYRGQDAEITSFTQAFFDAREAAMDRLQKDVFTQHPKGSPDEPVGIVGMTVKEATYGENQSAPLVEFSAVGTAIARLHPNDPRHTAAPPGLSSSSHSTARLSHPMAFSPSPTNTPFAALGGEARVRALVERFYDAMSELEPALARLHPVDADGRVARSSRDRFALFFIGWLGGPQDYIAQHGHPRLRMRHAQVPVDDPMAVAWMRCMRKAFDDCGVTGDLRDYLDARLGEVAAFMKNR